MPTPAQILRPLAERYRSRFGEPVPDDLVRKVPMQRLVTLIQRSLRLGLPLRRDTLLDDAYRGVNGHSA
jgi:hypothetical protein